MEQPRALLCLGDSNTSAFELADGAGVLVDRVLTSTAGPGGHPPAVLLVAPPPIEDVSGWAEREPEAFEGFEQGSREAHAALGRAVAAAVDDCWG